MNRCGSQFCTLARKGGLGNPTASRVSTKSKQWPGSASTRSLSSPSEARVKHRNDLDTLVSVLEVSATKRDAKGYLQKYTSKKQKPKVKAATQTAQDTQVAEQQNMALAETLDISQEPRNVAIVKIRTPQFVDDDILEGVAKTLTQLRTLGLLSIVVVDCGPDENRETYDTQALRFCEAIDSFSKPGSKILSEVIKGPSVSDGESPSILQTRSEVDDLGRLKLCLQHGLIPVVPSLSRKDDLSSTCPADAHQVVLTLTRYLTGMQFGAQNLEAGQEGGNFEKPVKIASVERIFVLDPLGGTPVPGRPGAAHRFVNLDQEYDTLLRQLMGPEGSPVARREFCKASATVHGSNLNMVKEALSVLPPTSSALITTPSAAATASNDYSSLNEQSMNAPTFGFDGMVTTRIRRNPLLHNLVTDKPVYSASLPYQRIRDGGFNGLDTGPSAAATLVKRGMPLTIFPNPRLSPWRPPQPGADRLRLTDNCIDLPRLVYLIEDSFNRKLDVDDYLCRVNENLAGVIIAGEYEGGAILTWEVPEGVDKETAYREGRLVPYLDKFAVLKSRQGSGGVADIVFNAMTGDCFPGGVCWRSRKDNPVNKWYFERSTGVTQLQDSNWTMFWTTPGLDPRHATVRDYEKVCRGVEPSWADNKHILD
ncbi:Amino-acid acetyltransferase-like protein [Emericellopsis cladophorae]|uniref:Amino-acid acetyltransferase, mitochondrial n=1 Tax=Emericellopsis cladophorae TaxID=2686198 RepID=A0A9P9Y1S6_9HYPO|nr:Amino-acid acetyltransferase-like protein [Emericellopsis cladophorae]KAI6781780.1 Amino-acid acetyltransferase-like protein [Emericellopsis cladophorae]